MNELWNLMLNGGYLTVLEEKRQRYKVKIPNYEIQKYFATAFIYNFINEENKIYNMMDSIIDGEIKLFESELKDYVLTSSSFMISDKEVFYQGFMLGLFMLLRDYYIANIELEAGKGRADMILESIDKNNISYIIEMKVAKSLKEAEEISQKALEQIKNKKYYNGLKAKNFKNIAIIALVFYEKEVKFKFEIV